MALNVPDTPKPDLIPEGYHTAICVGIVDLGDQPMPGEDWWHQVLFMFELPEVRMDVLEGGQKVSKPRWASRRFGLTKGQKGKLLPFLVGWRGKSFTPDELTRLDLKVLLGRCCQIQVVHDYSKGENTYANIAQAIPLPKGTVVPQPENPLVWFSWTEGTPIPDTWSKGMQWVKDLLGKSKQFKTRAAFELFGLDQKILAPRHPLRPGIRNGS